MNYPSLGLMRLLADGILSGRPAWWRRHRRVALFAGIAILQSSSVVIAAEKAPATIDGAGLMMASAMPMAHGQETQNTTTVTFNRRAARIPFGDVLHLIGIDHVWISTPDGTAAGMGDARGVPQSELPLIPMKVVDHTGQIPTARHRFSGVDRAAIATYMKPGQKLGPWMPLVNDCIGWAWKAIYNSRPHDIYSNLGPPGKMTSVLRHKNVVVYADGSIHAPGEQGF